ncbi:Response regulator NasT [Pseudomonas syringae pv. coriandricola]|uniref:Response regulator NasT n=6 Tax=Pseudomonas syringae group TaxID=136849 RepID=A0A3M3JC36_9PSED|nr:Response regulator NasT [Pseudomonas syringae pv. coriandricola]
MAGPAPRQIPQSGPGQLPMAVRWHVVHDPVPPLGPVARRPGLPDRRQPRPATGAVPSGGHCAGHRRAGWQPAQQSVDRRQSVGWQRSCRLCTQLQTPLAGRSRASGCQSLTENVSMLRILLINDTARKVGRLKSALTEAGFDVIDESGLTIDLPARVEAVRPDVILIDTESPGRDVMEQVVLVSRDQPRPIVMFTDEHDPGVMRQAIKSGVSAYIVEGIQAQRLQPILDVAMARFESDQALRAQLHARDQQLAERKRIELAKGLLMKMKDCNEEEAYTLMRRQAMSRQQKLIQVAEQIIAMSELLG